MEERLTELDCDENYQVLEENFDKAIDKLAEYENTSLSPEEVEALKQENEELKLQLAIKQQINNGLEQKMAFNTFMDYNKQKKLAIEKLEEFCREFATNSLDKVKIPKSAKMEICNILTNLFLSKKADLKGVTND